MWLIIINLSKVLRFGGAHKNHLKKELGSNPPHNNLTRKQTLIICSK